ncbi:(5-formylfuran-3-yl)methyl phosphate synthase [Gimesia fumaroli]|uniref:(5-formylfuran-3-yl)methyl phosphate synthase n=1 Tax=Gimesia fumaroli TaxID=2527976 RepID=A0A518IEZ9_9PLAN|nr:(5-formylfuran-3-yl)methyl phosphate synthase [Gimesia fumaroli]QDV51664.1 hypothetical protein Enr17x_37220 [Gimesia fumaroli]
MLPESSALNRHRVQLLVSARNRDEIEPALLGGCEILDFKDPFKGALGMVDAETVHSISEYFQAHPIDIPVSMALGELTDRLADRKTLLIPNFITYLKMGLAQTQGMSHWYSEWQKLKQQIEATNQTRFQWIAVAYADWEQAAAISPHDVLKAALESECAGLLIDTFLKQGQTLLDHLALDELNSLIDEAHSHQLKIALAGSLRQKDLATLANISPDIIGIRSAACRGSLRTDSIQEQLVQAFHRQLEQHFAQTNSG